MEELVHDKKGKYLSVNPSTYKIPGIRDLPQNLVVDIVSSLTEHASVMGSKATGEPPFIYGMSVFFAIQNAIRTVKSDANLRFPATPEAILMALE
jgi:xanthine dehydrogenase large subunit